MDDTPRSSKRRKLDTPNRKVSSPLPKPTSTRASGRLANRTVSYTNGDVEEKETPKRGARGAKGTKSEASGTLAKDIAVGDVDIYDDIEGALSVEPSARPSQRLFASVSREATVSSTDELQGLVSTPPKKTRRTPARSEKKSDRGASMRSVNGSKNGTDMVEENQDASSVEILTPSKRGKKTGTPATSARKLAIPRSSGRKRVSKVAATEEDVGPIPTEIPKAVKNQRLESHLEDEQDEQVPLSSKKVAANTRRRTNRTDHISNASDKEADEEDDDRMDVDGNSVLGSVLDPTEPSPFNKPASTQKIKALPILSYSNLSAGKELDLLKTIVLERIVGKRPSPLVGLDDEYKSVHQLVEHTITAGEGNSMLVIGARGSGKTALVNKVLYEVAKDNGGEYHVVRLNGFIHTDDKIALREIWRQLGKEMEVEEDGSGPGKNYADTLTTLLALLSHPSEQTGEITDQVAKAVIFVMDEFDLFATHPRQTLLYNLFDIAQSRKAPIAVLGLTTRIDVTNSLEKRVKSRFSHRYVHLSLAKTFTTFQEICKACLLVRPEDLSVEERGLLEGGTKSTPARKEAKGSQDVLSEWNVNITVRLSLSCTLDPILRLQKLFASQVFLTQHLATHFYRTKSVPAVLNSFLISTATLGPETDFAPNNLLDAPDSKLSLIPRLPTLGLALLIAAARLDIIHDSDTCNFNMAYDEYVTLASKARIQSAAGGLSASGSVVKVWGKDVARREWENLVDLGLVMPVIQGQAGGFGMIKCDVALDEIGATLAGEKGVDQQVKRWCKAI